MNEHNSPANIGSDTSEHKPSDSLAHQILNRIECENLKPRSKWYFVFKNDLFWAIGLLSVMIGSLSIAASIFSISYAEIDLYSVTHDSLLDFLYDTLPIMWFISIGIFIALGYYQIRNTRRGYRYSLAIIVGGSLALSCAGGYALHAFGFGEILEKAIGNHIPFHRPIYVDKQRIWINSNRGIIAGEVIRVSTSSHTMIAHTHGEDTFLIKDFSGRPWIIVGDELSDFDLQMMRNASSVKVIGLPSIPTEGDKATSTMFGCFVFAWDPEAQMVMQHTMQISNERKDVPMRSTKCKDIRPYQLFERLRAESI